MKKKLLALGLVAISTVALAQVSLFDMGLGTRAMGLGGAYAAVAEGPEGLLYNPAGLAQVRGITVDSTILAGWVGAGYVGAALPSLGAGIGYLGTSAGENLGFSQLGLIAGFGMDLTGFGFPVLGGVGLRFQSTNIAGEGSTGFGLDIGVLGRWPSPLWGTSRGFGDPRACLRRPLHGIRPRRRLDKSVWLARSNRPHRRIRGPRRGLEFPGDHGSARRIEAGRAGFSVSPLDWA
jgi:hypothetical protein